MGNIYQKAQQEQAKEVYQQILDRLEGLPADSPDWRDALKIAIDDIIQSEHKPETEIPPPIEKDAWDFSFEKKQAIFVGDDVVTLCPISLADEDFYRNVRMQYSLLYKSAYYAAKEKKESLFVSEALPSQVFYCIIKDVKENRPVGYLGIKDTRADLWEIAIELDGQFTHKGYGLRSIRLYLNEIQRITDKAEFRAVVEVDNLPSQKCFEKLGARLVGLCDSVVLKTDEEKERFEKRNLDLIDAHMIKLAERLAVESRKLLSHVLDYRLRCPL